MSVPSSFCWNLTCFCWWNDINHDKSFIKMVLFPVDWTLHSAVAEDYPTSLRSRRKPAPFTMDPVPCTENWSSPTWWETVTSFVLSFPIFWGKLSAPQNVVLQFQWGIMSRNHSNAVPHSTTPERIKSCQVCSSLLAQAPWKTWFWGCFWAFCRSLVLSPFKVINQPLSLHQQNPYLPALASHRLTRCQVSTFGFSQQKLQKFHGTTFKEPLRLQSFQPRSPSPLWLEVWVGIEYWALHIVLL